MRINHKRGKIVSRFSNLENVLDKWISLNQAIGEEWVNRYLDSPWWYNERATLSIFAGAVWKAGVWAFEEFSVEKRTKRGGNKVKIIGRCDLNFKVGRTEYYAEAKQVYPILNGGDSGISRTNDALLDAKEDTKELSGWGMTKLGIVFSSPRIRRVDNEFLTEYIRSYLRIICKQTKTVIAWSFPNFARDLRPVGRNEDFIYPGIVLLIQKSS